MGLSSQKNNFSREMKSTLRRRFIVANDVVLDLFCGLGEMFRLAYRGRVAHYHGVDRKAIFDDKICTLSDNMVHLSTMTRADLSKFTAIDLDAYGSPFDPFALVLKKTDRSDLKFFLTDGRGIGSQLNARITSLDAMAEGLPPKTKIRGNGQFYLRHHHRAIWKLADVSQWEVLRISTIERERKQVLYSYVELRRK